MWKMEKKLFLEILNTAKQLYPKEFLCFLGGNKQKEEINEFIFIPNKANENSVYFLEQAIPFDETIIGTIHSHPNTNYKPSKADKKIFQKYPINIIISLPFGEKNYKSYNQKSEEISIELIQ
jgi:proteasome lid subunit RPN8/RPN11